MQLSCHYGCTCSLCVVLSDDPENQIETIQERNERRMIENATRDYPRIRRDFWSRKRADRLGERQ